MKLRSHNVRVRGRRSRSVVKEVQALRRSVVEELVGAVQFLPHVFDEPVDAGVGPPRALKASLREFHGPCHKALSLYWEIWYVAERGVDTTCVKREDCVPWLWEGGV